MKVLVCSYSPQTHASYGVIVRDLFSKLKKKGVEVVQHGWFHSNSLSPVDWTIFPTKTCVEDNRLTYAQSDQYGEESFEQVLKETSPDIVWCLSDIYMSRYLDKYKKRYGFKLIRWTLTEGIPIDKDNIPSLLAADKIVAITQFAADAWKHITGENYQVIYHGVDSSIFKPLSIEHRIVQRTDLVGTMKPGQYLMCYVGMNQARKRPWLPFRLLSYLRSGAWGLSTEGNYPTLVPYNVQERRFMYELKDELGIGRVADPLDVYLWMHSVDDGTRWSFKKLQDEWGVSGSVIYTSGLNKNKGLSTKDVASIYQISDLNLMMSGSEGFGMPTIEAAACGVPTLFTEYGAMAEIGNLCDGYPISFLDWEPAPVSHVGWVNPNLHEAVASAYAALLKPRKVDVEVIKRLFDSNIIADQWMNVLQEVHSREVVRTIGETV